MKRQAVKLEVISVTWVEENIANLLHLLKDIIIAV